MLPESLPSRSSEATCWWGGVGAAEAERRAPDPAVSPPSMPPPTRIMPAGGFLSPQASWLPPAPKPLGPHSDGPGPRADRALAGSEVSLVSIPLVFPFKGEGSQKEGTVSPGLTLSLA